MNSVNLIGNITRDIELKYSQGGVAIAKFGIAINKKVKNQQGGYDDKPVYVDLTAFQNTAEILNQYFRKGSKIGIEGELNFEQWVDQDGQKRSKLSVTVSRIHFIDKKDDAQGGQPQQQQQPYNPNQQQGQPYAQPQQSQVPTQNNQYAGGQNSQPQYNQPQQSPNTYQQPQQPQQQQQYQQPAAQRPQQQQQQPQYQQPQQQSYQPQGQNQNPQQQRQPAQNGPQQGQLPKNNGQLAQQQINEDEIPF